MREIGKANGIAARLVSYQPDAAYGRHSHSNFYVSIMLLGSMQERTSKGDEEYLSPHCALMPPDFDHANLYGRHGALDLVFDFAPERLETQFGIRSIERNARRIDNTRVAAFVSNILSKPAEWREDGLTDLITLALRPKESVKRSPPSWFSRARDYFDDDPYSARVATVAKACGVHRVHLVRVFRDFLNMTPTEYRLQAMTLRAATHLQNNQDGISAIAAKAGFADASHFAREMRKRSGMSPSAVRRLFAA